MNIIKSFIILLSVFMWNCFLQKSDNQDRNSRNLILAAAAVRAAEVPNFLSGYARYAFLAYSDSYSAAVDLQTKIKAFTGSPGESTLKAAKAEWRKARISYLQTEILRFSSGPIDNKEILSVTKDGEKSELEPLINAWPLDETYLDNYISSSRTVSETELISANMNSAVVSSENDSAKNIAVGWHSIEYLLWGADASGNLTAGTRPYTDYTSASNASRRVLYLNTVTDLLVKHIGLVKDSWDPDKSGNYAVSFKANPGNTSLKNVMNGLVKFAKGEWGGERLKGLNTNSQEDEHSCFSDNSKNDAYYDAQGFINLYTGNYKTLKSVNETFSGLNTIAGSDSSIFTNAKTARDSYCLNENLEDSTQNQTCTSGSVSSRYDSLLISTSNSERSILTGKVQTAIVSVGDSIAAIAKNYGIAIVSE